MGMTYEGLMYENGWAGLRKDPIKAIELYQGAAALGEPRATAFVGNAYPAARC
jgi:TPR repeat protein